MSHLIYSTEAIVLKVEDRGETSRLFWLFTEQFGLVVAHGQAVRAAHSKLKHQLQLYNIAKIALVRGREFWRIVNVQSSVELDEVVNKNVKFHIAHISDLLLRLVHGEDPHENLFRDLIKAFTFLEQVSFDDTLVKVLYELRIMAQLGYISPSELPERSYFLTAPWGENLLVKAKPYHRELVKIVGDSLLQTQL